MFSLSGVVNVISKDVLVWGTFLVFLEAFWAYMDRMLTAGQMRNRGFFRGIPFLPHPACWADLLIFTPLIAYLYGRFGSTWTARESLVCMLIALFICYGMTKMWIEGGLEIPDFATYHHELTLAGWLHTLYFWAAFVAVLLFANTPNVPRTESAILLSIIAVHVTAGTVWPNIYTRRPAFPRSTVATLLPCYALIAATWFYQAHHR
ncbi:MAG: hypothetical protein JWO40_119 [Candidatus Doudnabacteria bacterium]|nr:hypothetical protein [Candidatus Doudnabacteria bacterium]